MKLSILRRDRAKPGQKPEDPPHQPPFVIGGFFGNDVAAQNGPIDAPDILPRQLHVNAGTDTAPVVRSQGQLEPLGHAVALDNELFGFQHLQRMGLDPAHSHLSQIFQMVGMDDGKPRKKPVPGMLNLGVHCFS
jgi:hypothetical protein